MRDICEHVKACRPGLVISTCFRCRWSVAVDAAIGKELSNFVVHDAHDLRLLRALGREAGLGNWLSVTQLNFDLPLHTLAPGRLPPPELLTLLQVMSQNKSHIQFFRLMQSGNVDETAKKHLTETPISCCRCCQRRASTWRPSPTCWWTS